METKPPQFFMMSKRQIILGAWLLIMSLLALFLLTKINVISDITQFLPDRDIENQHYSILLDELNRGSYGRLLFVRVNAGDIERTAKLSKSLRARLKEFKSIEEVLNGQIDFNINNYKEIFKYRYLLSPGITERSFTGVEIKKALNERILEIRSGMGMAVKQTLGEDPTNSFVKYMRHIYKWGEPNIHGGVWFAQDNLSALLIVQLKEGGLDIHSQQMAINIIRTTVSELTNSQSVLLDITGPGAFAVAIRNEIQKTLTILSIIAVGIIILILVYAYRSLEILLLTGIPLISAIIISITITNLIFGSIHGITLAFGITLLGVCLDYPVHYFSHLSDKKSPKETMFDIWPTIRLGVITTIFGYLVFLWSGFDGLIQLGTFSVIGLIVASVLTRWLLPECINEKQLVNVNMEWLSKAFDNRWRFRVGILVVIATGMFVSYVLLGKGEQIWEKDVSSLNPIPNKTRLLDQRIRNQIGVPEINHVFIITDTDPEVLLQRTELITSSLHELLELNIAKDVISPTDLLPSKKHQRERQAILPNRHTVENAVKFAIKDMPFKTDIFRKFIDDVVASRTFSLFSMEEMQKTPLGRLLVSDLFSTNGVWVAIIRLRGVSDKSLLTDWLKTKPDIQETYYNIRSSVSEIIDLYRKNAILLLTIAIVVMIVFMQILNRSYMLTARIMSAPILAILISLGVQVFFDVGLNIFHILSLPLIIGIGVDYSLFFNRKPRDVTEFKQTLHGIVISAASTLVAFGVLIITDLPVLVAIGQTVTLGVLTCFIIAFFMAEKHLTKIE